MFSILKRCKNTMFLFYRSRNFILKNENRGILFFKLFGYLCGTKIKYYKFLINSHNKTLKMKFIRTLFFVYILFFIISCKSENERLIVGKWQAAQFMIEDKVKPVEANVVNIEFKSEGKYVFNSTLNTHEEGKYKIKRNYLYTKDQSKENTDEKVVLIKQITKDTLVLEMFSKGQKQFLTLVKENNAALGMTEIKQDSLGK